LVQAACGDPVAHDELCEAIITAPEARIKPLNWRTADNNENNWRRLENAHPLYFEHHPDGWLIFSRAMGYLQTRPEYRDTILRRLLSDDRLSDARQLLVLHMLSNPTRQDHEKLLSIFHRTRVHWPDHSRSRQAWDASQTTLRYNPVALACLQTMARFGLSNELISVWERSRGKDPLTCWMALVAMGGSDDPVYLDAFRKHARNEWWAYARSKKAWRGFDCDNRNRAIGRLSRLEWDPFAALEFVSQYLKKHDPQWSPSAIAADSLAPPPLRLEFLGRHYKSKHERVADETSIRRAYEMLLELDTGRDCWPDMVRENMALTRHWMEKEKSLLGRLEYYMGDTQSEP
jgi:hypothetical protein